MSTTANAYQKIPGPFMRDNVTNKLVEGMYSSPALAATANLPWLFTEKIDGVNVRIIWDGYRVSFAGRSANSQMPVPLYDLLHATFGTEERESLFEQKFGLHKAILFAEGYGPKIQGGGKYSSITRLALFDVLVTDDLNRDWYLQRPDIEDVAEYFGIEAVPTVLEGTIQDAIDLVKADYWSIYGDFRAEGLVGVTKAGLRDRSGERIAVKIKARDFAK